MSEERPLTKEEFIAGMEEIYNRKQPKKYIYVPLWAVKKWPALADMPRVIVLKPQFSDEQED